MLRFGLVGDDPFSIVDGNSLPAPPTPPTQTPFGFSMLFMVIDTVSAALSGYHGFKRHNGSIGWGVGWFVLGGLAPVLTPVIAFAQGYAKPKKA